VGSERTSTTSIDDPEAIAETIREAAERNTKALRERPVPIALEPPTVFRP
jgi:tetrahydromethanopterin S-methyltransferase subunit A